MIDNVENASDCNSEFFAKKLAWQISNVTYPYTSGIFKELETSDYVKFIAYITVIIGGLIGNISVILTVALNRSMRTTINYYVANLAVADALICIFCMGVHSFGILTNTFILGAFMCKFSPFMQMACLVSSVLTLSAISCDRFMAIMFPLLVRITKQRTSIVIQIIWILSIAVSLPFFIFKQQKLFKWRNIVAPVCSENWPRIYTFNEETLECLMEEQFRVTYYMTCSVVLYFIPLIVMITAYSSILWKLWKSEVPGERHDSNINAQYRARRKVIIMVLVVLVAFIICWTPLQIQIFIAAFQKELKKLTWENQLHWVSHFLAFANSFINPIIYGGFNKSFRDGFCIVLRCGFRRERFYRNRTNDSKKTSTIFLALRGVYSSITSRTASSRLTFTTGLTSSPSRFTSKTSNGTNKNSSKKSNNMEMGPVYHPNGDENISPNMKDTCVNIADGKQLL